MFKKTKKRWPQTYAGVSAAARLGARHATEKDLELRVQQRHVFASEDLTRMTGNGVNNQFYRSNGVYLSKTNFKGAAASVVQSRSLVMCGLLALTTWQQTEDLLYLTQRLERNHFHIFFFFF